MLLAPWNSSSILEQNSCAKDLPFYIFVSTHDKTRASRIQLQKLDMPYLLHWKPNPKAHEALMPSELLTLLLNICLLPSMQTVSNGGYSEGTRDCWQCSLQPLFTVKESVTSSSNTKQLWMMPRGEWEVHSHTKLLEAWCGCVLLILHVASSTTVLCYLRRSQTPLLWTEAGESTASSLSFPQSSHHLILSACWEADRCSIVKWVTHLALKLHVLLDWASSAVSMAYQVFEVEFLKL